MVKPSSVGNSHSMFIRLISNEIATNIAPYYKSWSKVPASDKNRIYANINEGRCHNRGVSRKLKSVSCYSHPTETTQCASSTFTITAMEEKILSMQQVMGMIYDVSQHATNATSSNSSKSQLPTTDVVQ